MPRATPRSSTISPGRRTAVAAGRAALAAGAPILVDSAMVRPASFASVLPSANRDPVLPARPGGGGARRGAAHDALGGRGRAVASASGGRRGRDRQRPDGAVPVARNPRRGRRATGADPRLSGRVCRRRRGQGGARRLWPRVSNSSPCTGGAAAARSPRRRSTRSRARDDAVARARRHRRGRPRRPVAERRAPSSKPRRCWSAARGIWRWRRRATPSACVWDASARRTIDAIAARRGRRVAVLASGDPLWYGVGAVLAQRFAREEMTILPQPSAFSLAAARLGWPLAECAADQPARAPARHAAPAADARPPHPGAVRGRRHARGGRRPC